MTGKVISWSNVLARYDELSKLPNVSSTSVQDDLIGMAEAGIHGRLASRFSTPFSTSNITARDLMVDMLYIQVNATRQPDKIKVLQEHLDGRIKALLTGQGDMVDANGVVAAVMVGDTVWSSSQNYSPVFGLGDVALAQVSSTQLTDEATARGEFL